MADQMQETVLETQQMGNSPESQTERRQESQTECRRESQAERKVEFPADQKEEKKSDLSRAFSEDGALKTHVGGQALIEGIMMRGRYNWAVAVREPSGDIYIEEHDLASGRNKNGWMYWPLVRGCRAMVESLVLAYKALEIAAMHAFVEEDEEESSQEQVANVQDMGAQNASARVAGDEQDSANAAGAVIGFAGAASVDDPAQVANAQDVGARSSNDETFSWKDDFGRPDTMIDALGAQRTLEVVSEPVDGVQTTTTSQSAATQVAVATQTSTATQAAAPQTAATQILEEPEQKKSWLDEETEFGKKEMAVSMVLGLVLGVVLFIVAPAFLTNLIVGEYDSNTVLWNVVDGLLRVAVFVFYLWLIGRMSDIKRMFGYHGAEHKTIHCYEHGLPLTPENARSFPRLHVRCGTAFLIMVMIIAIFVYTVTPLNALIDAWGVPDGAPKLLLVIVVRILLMPVIAGISYEITVKWAGSHPDNPLVKVILWPGMQMQYLTTNEPDDSMIECAIAAMQRVLEREEAEAATDRAGSVSTATAETAVAATTASAVAETAKPTTACVASTATDAVSTTGADA